MIFIIGIIFIFGLLSECFSGYCLLLDLIPMALLSHCISSLLILLSYQLSLNQTFKKSNWQFYLLMFFLCYFVPLFGIIISFFIVCSLDMLHKRFHKDVEVLDLAINLEGIKPFYATYGSGGAVISLLEKEKSPIERTKAFFILSQTQLSNINTLIYKLLPDTSDEMRLLAFNILDKQEDTIMKRIHELVHTLETGGLHEEENANIEKNLAASYWELIYNHLISPELEESIQNNALSYALSAIKVLNNDATIWILLGKIYIHSKQYQLAEDAFNRALSSNVSPTQILPYLAELKFKAHDYIAVQNYLSGSNTLLDIPMIAPVKLFWDDK